MLSRRLLSLAAGAALLAGCPDPGEQGTEPTAPLVQTPTPDGIVDPTQTQAPEPTATEPPAVTDAPTAEPTHAPTAEPTHAPTAEPTHAPTAAPTDAPTLPPASPTPTPAVDADGDGSVAADDCDDADADVYPGAAEVCDGKDNDCDGATDAADDDVVGAHTYYADADSDGYGDAASPLTACALPEGASENDDDCDDARADLNPETVWHLDHDGDGYGDIEVVLVQCAKPPGYIADGTDCDDLSADYHPGASEEDCADPSDYNCDGQTGFADADGDGYAACEECDDGDSAVNPAATEICNGKDDDCDSQVDLADRSLVGALTVYTDGDGDGFGVADTRTLACEVAEGFAEVAGDCDDAAAAVNPDAQEVCAAPGETPVDEDCDGYTDDRDPSVAGAPTWYIDYDHDGYGVDAVTAVACVAPRSFVAILGDCDDTDGQVHPEATEICNFIDDDCDEGVDEDAADQVTLYVDADGDGYGADGPGQLACEIPEGFSVDPGDCDDASLAVNPAATEVCNLVDDDCDSGVDEAQEGEAAACAVLDCQAVRGARPDAPTGVYWIAPSGAGAFETLCDMDADGGGWTLMYKANEGVPGDPSGLWFGGPLNQDASDLLSFELSDDHYVNAIPTTLFNAGGYTSDEVRVGLYEQGEEVAFVKFSSTDSNNNDWFALNRLMDATWPDISTEPYEQSYYFTINGDASINRDFFLYRNYGGCPADNGWLVANAPPDPCSWETAYTNMSFLYSTLDGYQNYEDGMQDGTLGHAQVMALYTRRAERCDDGEDNDSDGLIDEGALGGSASCAAPTCDAVFEDDPGAPDGTYWLDVDGYGGASPFRTRCEQGEGGAWTLVYKLSDGVPGDANALWNGRPWGEGDEALLEPGPGRAHFVSRIVSSYWNNGITVSRVRMNLDAAAGGGKELLFNGAGSDKTSWFSLERALSLPWTDVASEPRNYFSIAGDSSNNRGFFISRNYGGCGADAGWMVAAGRTSGGCSWETADAPISLYYAPGETYVPWEPSLTAGTLGHAQTLSVWVQAGPLTPQE